MNFRFIAPRLATQSETAPAWRDQAHVPVARVLDASRCRQLADLVLTAHEAGQSWPSRTRYAAGSDWNINNGFRSSKNLPPSMDGLAAGYDALDAYARTAVESLADGVSGQDLVVVDEQCLVYQQGDHIGEHADDSALAPTDKGDAAWKVIKPERHLVGITWLTTQTDDGADRYTFAGGTFRFNSLVDAETGLPLDIRPAAGDTILFPANPWFRHQVLPVLAGNRIALTRWWKVSSPATAH